MSFLILVYSIKQLMIFLLVLLNHRLLIHLSMLNSNIRVIILSIIPQFILFVFNTNILHIRLISKIKMLFFILNYWSIKLLILLFYLRRLMTHLLLNNITNDLIIIIQSLLFLIEAFRIINFLLLFGLITIITIIIANLIDLLNRSQLN